ncbi:MAG: hypothetical protein AAB152_16205 [Candidatus Coatesbacteria bacterium]
MADGILKLDLGGGLLPKISMFEFFRYLYPGLALVVFDITIPMMARDPHLVKEYGFDSAPLIVAFTIASGFIFDSLKLYQFSRWYKTAKEELYAGIEGVLHCASGEGGTAFHLLHQVVPAVQMDVLGWGHSKWVMIDFTSKVFFGGAALWLAFLFQANGVFACCSAGCCGCGVCCLEWLYLLLAVLYSVIGWRLGEVAVKEVDTSNRKYLVLVGKYKAQLRRELGKHRTGKGTR